jgi:hypothetical protein
MLLAVAGLDAKGVAQQTQKLAAGDWSSFAPGDQAAFAFARKQASAPNTIDRDDVQSLVRHFGVARTLDIVWWACRCHYMTRVADGFQLPLERDNVFAKPGPPAKKEVGKRP